MTTTETPWVSRFTALMNREKIRERAEVRPKQILDVGNTSPQEASDRIENALRLTFYLDDQCVNILLQWAPISRAHSLELYKAPRAFAKDVYQRESPLPEFFFPWNLMGLAGTGKANCSAYLKKGASAPHLTKKSENDSWEVS